jgi:hypothetical protein
MEGKNNMNHQPNPPTPDAGAINELVKTAVHSHRIKLRVLNTVAFVFGFVAIATSIFIVCCYLMFYLPKQRVILQDVFSKRTVEQARTNTDSIKDEVKRMHGLLGSEVVMTYALSIGVMIVALAVGVLGLGTLILLTVVILNRRVALSRINANLTQISKQLREMQTEHGGGADREHR